MTLDELQVPVSEIELSRALHDETHIQIGVFRRLAFERDKYKDAIRKHRDFRGDDRCFEDDEELYKILPEGYTPPERDVSVELSFCERFIRSRRHPKTTYVSPQRRIEELETEVARLEALLVEGDQ